MRELFRIAILLCATLVDVSSAARSALRSIPVAEETPSPGTSASNYSLCVTLDLSAFSNSIFKESSQCKVKSSYVWTSLALPTDAERRGLCACDSLIQKLQEVKVPRCMFYKDGNPVTYAQLYEYAFGLCNVDGSTSAPSTPTTTSRDTATGATADRDNEDGVDNDGDEKEKSASNTSLIAGILAGVGVVVIAIFIGYMYGQKMRQATAKDEHHDYEIEVIPRTPVDGSTTGFTSLAPTPTSSAHAHTVKVHKRSTTTRTTTASTGSSGHYNASFMSDTGMWDDPGLLAVRVPYESVFFGPLLNQGGFGEVYKGTYKGETVAIKQLLPNRRKDLAQIDAFLSEVKLMSLFEHERIVKFVGVAWNALSDVCVIVEYMENGDLRSALAQWDGENRPQGFDADKIKIALHVAHALTYLHSLQPVIVHRDLKSKNILLNASYDAKLTDFGVSRERADSTMTASVGSSLWMAPEVMLGQRYDEKADVFSFGVVLSELDTQKLPYSHAKESKSDRKLPDSAILQMVSLGRLEVLFTDHAHLDLVQLGRECVQLDAEKRPSSAQVLHRVNQVLHHL